jgi:hypothetical protein
MQTRIVFNGQEYSGPEQMPDDVRKAFQEMLAQLSADADHSGVPDGLEGRGNVLGVQQSTLTINGRTIENLRDLPGPLRWLIGSLLGSLLEHGTHQAATDRAVPALPPEKQRLLETLDATTNVLGTLLQVLSVFLAGGLIVVGIWMILHMDASSRSQGGEFYVGLAVLAAVAWLVRIVVNQVRRKR